MIFDVAIVCRDLIWLRAFAGLLLQNPLADETGW
jgi:hypothetical protein